ncbi:MAG TPA: NB-ARC domain-containing protein [Polyangia bacterium]|nr:NB-ARC domain-containing protein [Polyangia bacterium]
MSIAEGMGAIEVKPSPALLRPRRLVGRESEIREVSESLASAPVTTLVGPGGVGKTALAIAVAAACSRDFPDGVTVVWLSSLRSPDLVAGEVAVQLGLPRSGGQSTEDALTGWLTERDVLLMIDNCEHVVTAVADLVSVLAARLPRLRVLATSREPLWIDGEVTYRLAPLAVVGPGGSLEEVAASSAVQLFRERAGARARGALDGERACRLVGEICRRVDGLPLAIELAAARVAALDPEDIASHLDDLFTLLPQSARRADGAQRSLRATVEWSDALLTEEERRLLRRLGVFAGRFDLGAIKDVCAIDGQTAARVADLTARLVEKSLLLKLADGGGYQLLETIRQYSVEQLVAAGEIDAARERHARFYQGVALQACLGLMTESDRPHLDAIARVEDNLRVALARLLVIDPQAALSLVGALAPYWWVRGRLREGIGWIEQALAAAPDAPPELRATARFGHGFLIAQDTEDWRAAARSIDVGIELLANVNEPPPILGMLLCLRGECDVFNGDTRSAVARTEAGIAIVRRHPRACGAFPEGFCMWNVANARRADGDADAALALFTECAELCRRRGLFVGEMVTCNTLGTIWEERAVLDVSQRYWERALRCRREINAVNVGTIHGSMPRNLLALARVTAKQGQLSTASKLLREALPIAHDLRDEATARQIADLLAQTSRAEPTANATLRPEGGVWHVAFNGSSVHVPDMKGLWHLRELVSRPRAPVLALSFVAARSEDPIPVGDAGPMLDREALRQYRKRLADLDGELDEAEARHDVEGHARRSSEREALLKEIARATGLGGKPRRTGSPAEKARLNVTRTIRHAITYLSTALPELATHLDESVATGVSCCYEPRTNVAWTT